MNNNELYHYGVLGMKWGVRRARNNVSTSNRSSSNKTTHEDYTKAHDRKSVKYMSNAELRNRVNRLQMERNYNQLNPNNVRRGSQYINKLIKAGTTVATITSTGLTIYNNIDKIKKLVK